MKSVLNSARISITIFILISIVIGGGKFCWAGDYPGKWYGWYCPSTKDMIPPHRGLLESQNPTIIDSWGYKAKDVDEIKDLIPEGFYYIMKHPEMFGHMRINETALIPWSEHGKNYKLRTEATEKYKGQAYLDEKGHLRNYKAGIPFPGTTDALKMAWNFVKRRFYGDSQWGRCVTVVIDKKGQARYMEQENNYLVFNGRLFGDPKPLYQPNLHNYEFVNTFGYKYPYDLRGTVPLTYRYDDPEKQDDMWMYLPPLRRTRRMATSQRWDRLPGGCDIMWDGFMNFEGKPTNYEWKYLGRKLLLAGRNSLWQKQQLKDKVLGGVDQVYQRVNLHVLQFIPKMTAPLSKGIIYIDPDTYNSYYAEYYDKRGRLWHFNNYFFLADKNGLFNSGTMIFTDVQRVHCTNVYPYGMCFNSDAPHITAGFFKMGSLKQYFGGR